MCRKVCRTAQSSTEGFFHDKHPLQLGHPINIREFYYQGYLLDYFVIGLKKIMLNCKPWVVWVWCGHQWAEVECFTKVRWQSHKQSWSLSVPSAGALVTAQCWPRSWMYAFLFRNFTSRLNKASDHERPKKVGVNPSRYSYDCKIERNYLKLLDCNWIRLGSKKWIIRSFSDSWAKKISAAKALLKAPNEALQDLQDADLISPGADRAAQKTLHQHVCRCLSLPALGFRARIRFFWAFACFS